MHLTWIFFNVRYEILHFSFYFVVRCCLYHTWGSTASATVWWPGCSLFRMWQHVWCSTLWPHNAGAGWAALASGSAAGGFQDDLHPGLPVSVRHGSSFIPGRRLSAGLRRRSLSATLCQIKDVLSGGLTAATETDVLLLRAQTWNSLPALLRQTDTNFEQFKLLLKTLLFRRWNRGTLWLTV